MAEAVMDRLVQEHIKAFDRYAETVYQHMDLASLKRDFGDDICFWGGGVDTQQTLPFGTPEQVSDEVKRCIDILAPGGGFVYATVHNITEGVPLENILAAFRTANA